MSPINHGKVLSTLICCALITLASICLRKIVAHKMEVGILERAERLLRPKGRLRFKSIDLRTGRTEVLEVRPPLKVQEWQIDIYRMKILKTAKSKKPRL